MFGLWWSCCWRRWSRWGRRCSQWWRWWQDNIHGHGDNYGDDDDEEEDSTLLAAGADCDFGGGYCTMFLFLFVDIPSSTLWHCRLKTRKILQHEAWVVKETGPSICMHFTWTHEATGPEKPVSRLFKHVQVHTSRQRSNVAETSYVSLKEMVSKARNDLGGSCFFFLNLTKVSNLQSGNPLSLGLSEKDSESGSLGPSIVATSGNCFAAARASWVSAMAKKWKNQKWSELHYPLVMSK